MRQNKDLGLDNTDSARVLADGSEVDLLPSPRSSGRLCEMQSHT